MAWRVRWASIALGAVLILGSYGTANAHSMGNSNEELTPPIRDYFAELERLQEDFKGSAAVLRGALDELKLWPAGDTLKICFFDGEPELKDFFVRTTQVWVENTSLRFDFGLAPTYRACTAGNSDDIRISFTRPGNWSYVGTDSLRLNLAGPSLNIGESGGRLDVISRTRLQELVLHELGHALGLEHEHQSPEAGCDGEFEWDKIYPYFKAQYGWSQAKVDFNLRAISRRLRTSPYDPQSIMHYTFADWMFKRGKASRCFVKQAETLSAMDVNFIRGAYPVQTSQQDDDLQRRAAAIGGALGEARLDTEQLAKAGSEFGAVLKNRKRKLRLEFVLAPDAWANRSRAGSDLGPCDGAQKLDTGAIVGCGVAADGSGLVISISPQ